MSNEERLSKLEQLKADYASKLKRLALADAGAAYDDLDRYARYLSADDEESLEKQANSVLSDAKAQDRYADVYDAQARIFKPF